MAIQVEKMNTNLLLLPVLPTDITIDIFSRLSVESVLSCKRVCKSWRTLIDDPGFAQAHTYRLLLDDEEQQQKSETFEFFLYTCETDFDKYNYGEHTLGDITFKLHRPLTHDYPFPLLLPLQQSSNSDYSKPHWLPVGSCNGLICLVSNIAVDYNSKICVYNPLTREYVNLPILAYEQEQPLVCPYIITDFGYHPCTKEYKVFEICYKRPDPISLGQGQISVYTLGSGSSTGSGSGSGSGSGWRSKGETEFQLYNVGPGVLVNGALHWFNLKYYFSDKKLEIVAFDLAQEKWRIVPSPLSAIFPLRLDQSALGVLEGRFLCMMMIHSCSNNENFYSMWVMNQDYCRSWTKKYNIPSNEPYEHHLFHKPLAQSKGGKILLQSYTEMKIVSSDLKNKSSFDHHEDVHLIRVSKKADDPDYQIIPYTKSFVSLIALGEDGARKGRNKEIWMKNNNNTHLLPANITIDILSRLSVDSVILCKCVCKTWRDLINDPVFARTHTDRLLLLLLPDDDDEQQQQQQQQQKSAETFEFLVSTRSNYGKYNFIEYTHDEQMTFIKLHKSITYDYPFSLPLDQYSYFHNSYWLEPYWIPIGSCNGLVCLASNVKGDHNMCVYNPVTREYVNLPSININNSRSNTYHQPAGVPVATGFGYHPYTKLYKVVTIYHKPINYKYNDHLLLQIPDRYSSGHISVYTLGSGRTIGWRSKGETEYWLKGEGVLANGALHWLRDESTIGNTTDSVVRMDIVAFDLAEEEFRRVPPPPSPCHTKLGVLGGFLCAMVTKSIHEKVTELWVLSNSSIQENCYSWTKKYSIPWCNNVMPFYNPPLARLKGGKVLLQYDYKERISSSHSKITMNCHKRIISYDPKRSHVGDNYEVVGAIISSIDANYHCRIIPYMKSFVSLKALGEHGARIGRVAT